MREWIKERGLLVLTSILIQIIITAGFVAAGYLFPVHAVKEAPPTVTACLLVATTGNLQIYRCQDADRGIEFYTNQLGFMFPISY